MSKKPSTQNCRYTKNYQRASIFMSYIQFMDIRLQHHRIAHPIILFVLIYFQWSLVSSYDANDLSNSTFLQSIRSISKCYSSISIKSLLCLQIASHPLVTIILIPPHVRDKKINEDDTPYKLSKGDYYRQTDKYLFKWNFLYLHCSVF